MPLTDLALVIILLGVIIALGVLLYRRSKPRQTIGHFASNELDLVEMAMGLIPNLTLATYIAALVRRKGRYPLTTHSDFLPLTSHKGFLLFDGRRLTFEQAERFFPKEFFPIENEQQLLCRLLAAFQRGDFSHAEEYRKKRDASAIVGNRTIVTIPGPEWKPE
jgi:hypothetical protein